MDRRNAAADADLKRRKLEQRDHETGLNIREKVVGESRAQIPLCFASLEASDVLNAPKYFSCDWNMEFDLIPSVGVFFHDVHKKHRCGLIKEVTADKMLEVYVLYSKETLTEVFGNISQADKRRYRRYLDSMQPNDCFQSIYTDILPLADVVGIFKVTFPFCSVQSAIQSTLQHLRVIGWLCFENVNRDERLQMGFFQKFRLTADMLHSYFGQPGNTIDYFKTSTELGIIRDTLKRWLNARGAVNWNPRKARRLDFDIHIPVFNCILALLQKVPIDDKLVTCTGSDSGKQFTWCIDAELLKTALFQRELHIPLKANPYDLGPARGTIYLEGPLYFTLVSKPSLNVDRAVIKMKFSRIVRLGWNNEIIWEFPDP